MKIRQKTYIYGLFLGIVALVLVGYTALISLKYFERLEHMGTLKLASRIFTEIEVFSAEMRMGTQTLRPEEWTRLDRDAKEYVRELSTIPYLSQHGRNLERMFISFERLHERFHETNPSIPADLETRKILIGQMRIEASRMSSEVDYAFDVVRVGMKSMAKHLLVVAWIWVLYLFASGLTSVFLMQTHVLNPLRRLEHDTAIIGQGNLKHRSDIRSNDEIGSLSKVLNETAEKLDQTLVSKQSLEVANLEIERSNKELQQFAYVASHDLQEPLRMVSSFSQLLVKRYRDKLDQDGQEFIDFVNDGAMRMQSLIRDLLAYSRIRTKGAEMEQTNLNDVVSYALGNLQFVINERNVTIERSELPTIPADHTQMVQLFQNLVGNAIKFCEDKPVIQIGISNSDKQGVTLFVRDNGIGIDPRYQERIFQIFQRLNPREQFEGNGIGLALCQRIMNRHNGRISLESAVGEGSTFYLYFPMVN